MMQYNYINMNQLTFRDRQLVSQSQAVEIRDGRLGLVSYDTQECLPQKESYLNTSIQVYSSSQSVWKLVELEVDYLEIGSPLHDELYEHLQEQWYSSNQLEARVNLDMADMPLNYAPGLLIFQQ